MIDNVLYRHGYILPYLTFDVYPLKKEIIFLEKFVKAFVGTIQLLRH